MRKKIMAKRVIYKAGCIKACEYVPDYYDRIHIERYLFEIYPDENDIEIYDISLPIKVIGEVSDLEFLRNAKLTEFNSTAVKNKLKRRKENEKNNESTESRV